MLLNLLDTSTRIAYAKQVSFDYPVPSRQRHFISAGVHLTQQNASLIAVRAAEVPEDRRAQTLATNFADYLNALLCKDLISSILELHKEQAIDSGILPEVKIDISNDVTKHFFATLSKSETWRKIVDQKFKSLEDLIDKIESRIRAHRNFSHFNIDALPDEVAHTRASAGVPIAELAAALRAANVIPANTLVLLRIDQHEELFELERHSGLGHVFRQVINAALARRDPRVAYRIGTRHYAWDADVSAWGSGAPLDPERDYSVIDLDLILRRSEHGGAWKFPDLAKDVLERRLTAAGFAPGRTKNSRMAALFGKSLTPSERARHYVAEAFSQIKTEEGWAAEWKNHLDLLWNSGDPLEAKFGEAWLRQVAQKRKRIPQDGASAVGTPWRKSPWWAKERSEIALMQIAGERRQALIWAGERQVIDLAGSNILAFMTVCKCIWATWQRRNPKEADKRGALPTFALDDQVIGIIEASQVWFKKIQVGLEADRRERLISSLGGWFRRRMLLDRALSYPGHSGFSLLASDLNANSELINLIKVCRDHGDLLEYPHTTKDKDQAQRLKWYLHPLLCPLFRIPHVRTKEPIYTNIAELQDLYTNQAKPSLNEDENSRPPDQLQLGLPGV